MTTHPPSGGKESKSLLFYISPYSIRLYVIIPYSIGIVNRKTLGNLHKSLYSRYLWPVVLTNIYCRKSLYSNNLGWAGRPLPRKSLRSKHLGKNKFLYKNPAYSQKNRYGYSIPYDDFFSNILHPHKKKPRRSTRIYPI